MMSDAGQRDAPLRNDDAEFNKRREAGATSDIAHRTTALAMARSIVAEQFGDALAAVLAGSFATGKPTVTSDLDIVVLLAGSPAPFRETTRVGGTPVELFVHSPDSLTYWYERERSEGRCTLAHMLATGIPLAGDETRVTQMIARQWVADGPGRWTAEQLEYRRYALTDALDDLVGASEDPDERDAVAGQVLTMVGELALSLRGGWQGRGKWLVRQMRTSDAELAERLMGAHREVVATGHVANLVAVCDAVLNEVGGRLTEGFSTRS